jgi:hypothetical protein
LIHLVLVELANTNDFTFTVFSESSSEAQHPKAVQMRARRAFPDDLISTADIHLFESWQPEGRRGRVPVIVRTPFMLLRESHARCSTTGVAGILFVN